MMAIRRRLIRIKTKFLRWFDLVVKQYPMAAVLVPFIGLLFGRFVLRRDHYIRYTATENLFGHHRYFFPDFEHVGKIDWAESLGDKYFTHDTVGLEPSDTVLEVGAARGITTQVAAKRAERVIAIEASPRAFECLKRNVVASDVELLNRAAWSKRDQIEIHYGKQSGDDSPITPNSGFVESRTVQAERLEDLVDEPVDFLKVEAEGVEPEVIEGIGSMKIDRIVVNCSAERYGESPRERVENLLRGKGYEIVDYIDGRVFARLP